MVVFHCNSILSVLNYPDSNPAPQKINYKKVAIDLTDLFG